MFQDCKAKEAWQECCCAYAFNLVLVQLCKINLQKLSGLRGRGELVSRGGGAVRLAFDLAFHLGQTWLKRLGQNEIAKQKV